MSQTLAKYPNEMPAIMVQMLQIGEETGELGEHLERLAKFYNREVNAAVDTLVSLIEPALIILLGAGRRLPLGFGAPADLQHCGPDI
jgi:type II secretory pathway component PulF